MKVTCKANGKEATVDVNIGTNLDEAVGIVGEEVVYNHYAGKAKLQALGKMRSMLSDTKKKDGSVIPGASADEVIKAMTDWKPTLGPTPASPVEKLKKIAAGMSEDEIAEFVKSLKKK